MALCSSQSPASCPTCVGTFLRLNWVPTTHDPIGSSSQETGLYWQTSPRGWLAEAQEQGEDFNKETALRHLCRVFRRVIHSGNHRGEVLVNKLGANRSCMCIYRLSDGGRVQTWYCWFWHPQITGPAITDSVDPSRLAAVCAGVSSS